MKTKKNIHQKNKGVMARAIIAILAIGLLGIAPGVLGVEVSQTPMSHRLNPPPPNAMFVLDNSGSMDWEFMTTQNEGVFDGDIEYLFDDPGDNTYSSGDSNGTILSRTSPASGATRGLWKSQWSGYNKLFYNPKSEYLHWPGKTDVNIADLAHVRSNPQNSTPTFDLTAEYHAVSLTTATVVVDNTDPGFLMSNASHWGTIQLRQRYRLELSLQPESAGRHRLGPVDPDPSGSRNLRGLCLVPDARHPKERRHL